MSEEKHKTTAPPRKAEEPHAEKHTPAKVAVVAKNPNEDIETQLWVIGFVILCGFIISVIFGTSGMSTTLVDAETLSTIGNAAVKTLSFAAMLHINFMQFAHALGPKPKSIKFGKMAETFSYYVVDWTMTFAGFAGWVLIATIMSGDNGIGKSIFMGFLIALAAGGALLTSWGTEKLARVWLDMYHALNKVTPDYKPARKGLYSAAGWLGLFVSWGASFFGVINISVKAGVDMQYMPSAFAVGTAAFLLPLMLSGVEYYLLKIKNRSKGQNLALGLCFLIDGGVIFGGLGGIDLTVEVALGAITGPDLAMIATAIISKAFSAYVGSVGGEKPHIDAQLIDEEDAPAAQTSPTSSTTASAAQTSSSSSPATQTDPTPKTQAAPAAATPSPSTGKLSPPPQYTITPQQWEDLVNGETEIEPFWDRHLSPSWLAICNIDGKEPVLIGFVPFDWVPDKFLPTPPAGMSYPKSNPTDRLPKKGSQPEPTYHPVGMGAVNLEKKKTPPPPADNQGRYDA